ncbi:MAG: DUF3078 domain-containing protein [Bacteroidota bacterium]
MHKNIPVFIFLLIVTSALSARAQNVDSIKKVNKIDTAILNKYRIDPPKNSLPVPTRTTQIKAESIPIAMIDYHVNYWRKWINVGLNFSQSGFTDNYQSGGTNAIAMRGDFNYRTEYKKAPFSYTMETAFTYGVAKNKGQGSRKTQDRLFFDNKFATQMSKSWYFFGSVTFESQFDKGYIYNNNNGPTILISKFLAPGYLTESVGFEFKPVGWFSTRIGTGTARQTFVIDTNLIKNQPNNYGVKRGKKVKNDLAFQVVSQIMNKNLDKGNTMFINARYALFIPYEKHIRFITHRVDLTLTARVNRLVNVNITGNFIYDKAANNRFQASEGLAMGVAYKFPY